MGKRQIKFIDIHHDLANYFTDARELLRMPEKDFSITDVEIRHSDLPTYESVGTKALFATVFPLNIENGKIFPKEPKKMIEKDAAVYQRLFNKGLFRQIKTANDLENNEKIGLIMHMEGADAIETSNDLDLYREMGVRSIGLTWNYENRFAGGCDSEAGLSDEGKKLLGAMAERQLIFDLTHLNRRSFKDALDNWHGPCMASHTALASFYNHKQNLEDWQIEKVVEKGGLVGISFFNLFYGGPKATFDLLLDQLDYFKKKFGLDNLVIGSDYFGFGLGEHIPGLANVSSLPQLADKLIERGWSESDVDKFLYKNAYDFLINSLPKKP